MKNKLLLLLFIIQFFNVGIYSQDKINVNCPIITKQPESQQVCLNEAFILEFIFPASGYKYQWYKNGVIIRGATSNVYSIIKTKASDYGNYYCHLTSSNVNCGDLVTNTATISKKLNCKNRIGSRIITKDSIAYNKILVCNLLGQIVLLHNIDEKDNLKHGCYVFSYFNNDTFIFREKVIIE